MSAAASDRSCLHPVSEILRRGADDHLIDFHLGRLLDCVSDRARDGVGRNSHFVKLAPAGFEPLFFNA